MQNTSLKSKIRNGELTLGSWITIGHPSIIEVLAESGFDWLAVDVEHNLIDPSSLQILISTIQSRGMAALVRVQQNEEVYIKHAMDAGADGVIVPMIKTKHDALSAVNHVHYPPLGKRGVGLSRAQRYGQGFEDYKKWLVEYSVVIAQIEHYEAIDNLEEIFEVPQLDAAMIGPYDLSGSLGMPGSFEDFGFKAKLQRFKEVCSKMGIRTGYHVVPPKGDLMLEAIDAGHTFLAVSTDFMLLGDKSRALIEEINSLSK
ncbi:2,4-dihydroxyhept-2-ene-1,7-dioic acid aldolase [Cryomorphaceae bacterium]|nr:2,4-dihydroxyhept-2-ene-1,7-dioic acid aldolase [Cryomorphaceae bacterium]